MQATHNSCLVVIRRYTVFCPNMYTRYCPPVFSSRRPTFYCPPVFSSRRPTLYCPPCSYHSGQHCTAHRVLITAANIVLPTRVLITAANILLPTRVLTTAANIVLPTVFLSQRPTLYCPPCSHHSGQHCTAHPCSHHSGQHCTAHPCSHHSGQHCTAHPFLTTAVIATECGPSLPSLRPSSSCNLLSSSMKLWATCPFHVSFLSVLTVRTYPLSHRLSFNISTWVVRPFYLTINIVLFDHLAIFRLSTNTPDWARSFVQTWFIVHLVG